MKFELPKKIRGVIGCNNVLEELNYEPSTSAYCDKKINVVIKKTHKLLEGVHG